MRWSLSLHLRDHPGHREKIDGRGLTYYTLDNGKIVVDDPIETPDLSQELAALVPSPVS